MYRSTLVAPLLAILAVIIPSTRADPPSFGPKDEQVYDYGDVGIYPELKYKTTKLVGPQILRRKWDPICDDGAYYMLCPRGLFVSHGGPMLIDNDGYMVWHTEAYNVAYGLTVQTYMGEDYLTFWSGNDQVIGHGSGSYYMYDKNYKLYKKIDAYGNLTGDLHEFKITRDNTALLTSYLNIPWNLGAYGRPGTSWIWDCYIQEIDIETGELLFQWRATDHFTFDDCYNPLRTAGPGNNPWDWYHINSIEKDKRGNYLISSRYAHTVSYIHGRTGEVLWNLGGKRNNFTDLSNGAATDFSWQHDARWVEEGKTISIFDNAAYFANQTLPARGIVLEVDVEKFQVKLAAEAKHPRGYVCESQGSMQVFEDGRMLMGYGNAAGYSEFSAEGELQCDMQYGALYYKSDHSFSPSGVMSYRVYKHPWHGWPTEDPKIKFEEGAMYVSWNGATELKHWMLEGATGLAGSEKDWRVVAAFPRLGFESNVTVDDGAFKMFRLTAYDADSRTLGVWLAFSGGEIRKIPIPVNTRFNAIIYIVFGAVIALVVNAIFRRRFDVLATLHGGGQSSAKENSPPLRRYVNGHTTPTLSGRDAEEAVHLMSPKQPTHYVY